MNKSIIITISLMTLLSSNELPQSNQFTDWDKDKCLNIRSNIIKGFKKGIKFEEKYIQSWNKYCHESTQFWVYTPKKCESMYKTLINVDLTNVNKKTWNKLYNSIL